MFLANVKIYRGYLFFSVKDRNLFHRVDIFGNIFTSGAAMRENITDGVHEINKDFFFIIHSITSQKFDFIRESLNMKINIGAILRKGRAY